MMVINDKPFKMYLSVDQISTAVSGMAERMNLELKDKSPLFLIVLNGAFMFASDLLKKITIDCGLSFVKISSYEGMSSTNQVKQLIGLDEDIKGRTVVIVEDIVDTGVTMENLITYLELKEPAAIKIATLLHKPEALQKNIVLDYVGIEVANKFLVGYGLDYDGRGRNLQDIYILDKN
ncbi:MAG TPA: hypoxanthine phosphoribosyltransferase [Bacteroidia bacterium]|jgi:hypoxanthine phosphoribosyltransferase|nr:hypoxanthine phosphoribosyltransferase [Bacteroidia bacterium]